MAARQLPCCAREMKGSPRMLVASRSSVGGGGASAGSARSELRRSSMTVELVGYVPAARRLVRVSCSRSCCLASVRLLSRFRPSGSSWLGLSWAWLRVGGGQRDRLLRMSVTAVSGLVAAGAVVWVATHLARGQSPADTASLASMVIAVVSAGVSIERYGTPGADVPSDGHGSHSVCRRP